MGGIGSNGKESQKQNCCESKDGTQENCSLRSGGEGCGRRAESSPRNCEGGCVLCEKCCPKKKHKKAASKSQQSVKLISQTLEVRRQEIKKILTKREDDMYGKSMNMKSKMMKKAAKKKPMKKVAKKKMMKKKK